MSAIPIQILTYTDRKPTDALLQTDLAASALVEVEKEWGPFRRNAARKLLQAGRIQEVPRHWHWDWGEKSKNLQFLAYRCFGIECAGKMQGLLMVLVAGKQARLDPDAGKPLVYIDYVETAPWNVIPLVDVPQYSGVGMVLMRTAVQLSYDEGFHGRIGLHALPQAEEFYRDKCGMHGCGLDPAYQNLPYYEMTRAIAARFTSNSSGGEA
jgi:hypothetical protein